MREDLKKIIEDSWEDIKELIIGKAEAEQKPKNIWDLKREDGKEYYILWTDGHIDTDFFTSCLDETKRNIGNAFLTKEEAEFELERRKIEAIMRKYSRPFKHEEDNWYIEYSHYGRYIGIDALCEYDCGIIYFESEEIARLIKYWFRVKNDER